jgi:hypothetical protein
VTGGVSGCQFAEVGTAHAWDPHVSWRQRRTVSRDRGHRSYVQSARATGHGSVPFCGFCHFTTGRSRNGLELATIRCTGSNSVMVNKFGEFC